MDVCPICFATSQPLSPRLIPTSLEWTWLAGTITIDLFFGENMDNGPKPDAGEFFINIDGTVTPGDTDSWISATQFRVSAGGTLDPGVDVFLRYPVINPLFHSALDENVTPFDIEAFEP